MSTSATHTQSHRVKRKPPPSLEQYPSDEGSHKRSDSASATTFELFPDLPASPTESVRKVKPYSVGHYGQGHYTVRRRTLSTMSTPSLIRDMSDSSSNTSFSIASRSGASSITSLGSVGVLVSTPSSRRMSIQPPPPAQDHTSTSSKHKLRFLGIAIGSRKSVDNQTTSHDDIGAKNRKGARRVSMPLSHASLPSRLDANAGNLPRQTHALPSGYTSEPEPESDLHPVRKPWLSSIPRKRSSLSLVTNGTTSNIGLSSNSTTATATTTTSTTTMTILMSPTTTNTKTKTTSLSSSSTTISPTPRALFRADKTNTIAKTSEEIEGEMYVSPRPAPVPASTASSSSHSRSSSSLHSHSHSHSTSTSATSHNSSLHQPFKSTPALLPVPIPAPSSAVATSLARNGNVSTSSTKTNTSANTNTSTTTNISHVRKKFFDHVPIFRRRRKEGVAGGEDDGKDRGIDEGARDEDKVTADIKAKVNVMEKLGQMSRTSGEKSKVELDVKENDKNQKNGIIAVKGESLAPELWFGDRNDNEFKFGSRTRTGAPQTIHQEEEDGGAKPKPTLCWNSISVSSSKSSSDWKSYLDLDLDLDFARTENELERRAETTSTSEGVNRDWYLDGCGGGYEHVLGRGLGSETGYGYGYEAFRRGGKFDLGLGLGLEAVDEVESRYACEDEQDKCEWGSDLGLGSACMRSLKAESEEESEGKTVVVPMDECERNSEEEELLREEELMKELLSLRKKRKGRRERERMGRAGVEVEVKTVHQDD